MCICMCMFMYIYVYNNVYVYVYDIVYVYVYLCLGSDARSIVLDDTTTTNPDLNLTANMSDEPM